MKINLWFVNATAAIFTIYGLGFIFLPVQFAEMVTGVSPTTATALTDMRATYGGMSFAVGVLLFVMAAKPELNRLALFAVFILMLAMAAGRSIGLLTDGLGSYMMCAYLILELLAATVAALLILRSGKSLS